MHPPCMLLCIGLRRPSPQDTRDDKCIKGSLSCVFLFCARCGGPSRMRDDAAAMALVLGLEGLGRASGLLSGAGPDGTARKSLLSSCLMPTGPVCSSAVVVPVLRTLWPHREQGATSSTNCVSTSCQIPLSSAMWMHLSQRSRQKCEMALPSLRWGPGRPPPPPARNKRKVWACQSQPSRMVTSLSDPRIRTGLDTLPTR